MGSAGAREDAHPNVGLLSWGSVVLLARCHQDKQPAVWITVQRLVREWYSRHSFGLVFRTSQDNSCRKGAGGTEPSVTYSTSVYFRVEHSRFRRVPNLMLSGHFEDRAFLLPSHLLKFLRCTPVALVIGRSRNTNVIRI